MKIAFRHGRPAHPSAEPKRLAIKALAVTWFLFGLGCLDDSGSGSRKLSPDDGMTLAPEDAEDDEAVGGSSSSNDSHSASNDAGWTKADAGWGALPALPGDAGALLPGLGIPGLSGTPSVPGPINVPGLGITPSSGIPGLTGSSVPGLSDAGIPGLSGSGTSGTSSGIPGLPGLNIPGLGGISIPGLPGLNIPGAPGTGAPATGAPTGGGYDFGPNASATKLASNSPEFAACYLDYIACNVGGATRDCVVRGIDAGCLPSALLVCVEKTEACSPQTGLGPGISAMCTQVMHECTCAIYKEGPAPGGDIACP